MYRQRFGLIGHPLPQDAQGKTFFDKSPGFQKLERAFRQLIADPGLGVLTADAASARPPPCAISARNCPSPTIWCCISAPPSRPSISTVP